MLRDDRAHLEQVSVHPAHAGRRIGARLIDAVLGWAHDRGDRQLTLTTFADVPWNAPYYERLGFRPLPDAALAPQLAAELADERQRFAAPRLAMVRSTGPRGRCADLHGHDGDIGPSGGRARGTARANRAA